MDKIIIDTDIGVDDAIALRYGMLTHEVIGVTCTLFFWFTTGEGHGS